MKKQHLVVDKFSAAVAHKPNIIKELVLFQLFVFFEKVAAQTGVPILTRDFSNDPVCEKQALS